MLFQVGEVCAFPAKGQLQCKYVVNAVGPLWCLYTNKDKCASVLRQTFLQAFVYSDTVLEARSLATPAISTGKYTIA